MFVGCTVALLPTTAFTAASFADIPVELRLQNVLDDFLWEHPSVPGIMVRLKSDEIALDWMGATGIADRESGTPIRSDQPARLAITTKT